MSSSHSFAQLLPPNLPISSPLPGSCSLLRPLQLLHADCVRYSYSSLPFTNPCPTFSAILCRVRGSEVVIKYEGHVTSLVLPLNIPLPLCTRAKILIYIDLASSLGTRLVSTQAYHPFDMHHVENLHFDITLFSHLSAQRFPCSFSRHPVLNLPVPLCWRRLVMSGSPSGKEDSRRWVTVCVCGSVCVCVCVCVGGGGGGGAG